MASYITLKKQLNCMCRGCECQRSCSEHCLTLAINIPQVHECICSPDPEQIKVDTGDVVAGLLKYNSNLTKYLSKYQAMPSEHQPAKPQYAAEAQGNPQLRNGQKSIVDIYNLNVRPPGQGLPANEKEKNQEGKQKNERNNDKVDFQQQTSPRNQYQNGKNKNKKPKPPKGSNEQKLEKHMKQLSDGSRYLSNTGFKKYFGRQCFQNYGRQNTTGVADGIVYNNYLKTFNISPHCGTNMPLTQQTRKRTLVTGDSNKYNNTNPIPESHYGNRADRQAKEGYHRKELVDMPKIIEQSKQYHEDQQNYNVKITTPPQDGSAKYINTVYEVSRKLVPPPPPPFIPPRSTSKKQYNASSQNKQYQSRQRIQDEAQYTKRQNRFIQQKGRPTQFNTKNYASDEKEGRKQGQNMIRMKYAENENGQNYDRKQNAPKRQYEQWQDEDDEAMQHRMKQKKILVNECYYNIHLAHDIEKRQKPLCPLCAQRRYSKCCCGP